MSFDYAPIVQAARAVVAEFGRVVRFEKVSRTAADVSKPWDGSGAPLPVLSAQADVAAAFVPPAGNGFGRDVVTDAMLASVTQVALVAPDGVSFDLETAGSITDTDNSRWAVEWVYTLKPANEVLLYAFGVKR